MSHGIIGIKKLMHRLKSLSHMQCRVSKFQRHPLHPYSYIACKKREKITMSIGYSPLPQIFFPKIRLSSAISLLPQFRLPSIQLPLFRLFDFGNSHAVSFWRVFPAQSAASAANCATARWPVPTFVNCRGGVAKLETAGTRSRWPGLTSCVSRLTMF